MNKTSFVIVSWNTKEYLEKCLNSLLEKCGKWKPEIIVVDNASFDGSSYMVSRAFPSVVLIANKENPGFGAAVNQGINVSTGEDIVIMNSDVEFVNDILNVFGDFQKSNPRAGVLAPRLLNTDGSLQVSYNYLYPNVFGALLSRLFFGSYILLAVKTIGFVKKMLYAGERPRKIAWAGGSCLLVKRAALKKAGSFDENFFLYGEETDICRRIAASGFELYYLPQALVVHHQFKSSGQNLERVFVEMYKSELYYFRKYYGDFPEKIVRAAIFINLRLKVAVFSVIRRGDKRVELSRNTMRELKKSLEGGKSNAKV